MAQAGPSAAARVFIDAALSALLCQEPVASRFSSVFAAVVALARSGVRAGGRNGRIGGDRQVPARAVLSHRGLPPELPRPCGGVRREGTEDLLDHGRWLTQVTIKGGAPERHRFRRSRSSSGPHTNAPGSQSHRSRRTFSSPSASRPRPGREEGCSCLDGQVHPDTHVLPMGNYVIRMGNYVTASRSALGNFVIVDTTPGTAELPRCIYSRFPAGMNPHDDGPDTWSGW